MATNAKALQDYFAGLDAAEEADAKLAGVTPDEYREAGLPSTGPLAALSRAPYTAKNFVGPPTEEQTNAMAAGMTLPDWQALSEPEKGKKAPEASPIPIKTAPSGSDAAKATASTLPTVTADKPSGKPDSSGKDGMPAPSSEGAGGDSSERDLYLARLAAQNAAGFGGMGAGKNIDMGIADTLGERLKQVQALRAKREERGLEQAKASSFASRLPALFPGLTPEQQTALRETITAGGNVGDALTLIKQFKGAQTDKEVQRQVNEAALASAVARYPELATSFEALRPVAGEYPQKDFAAMLDKAAGGKAAFEAKGAATRFMVDKQGLFNQLTPIEVDKQKLQNDRLRQQIDLDAKTFKLKEREAEAAPGKTEQEFKEKLITLADKEKGFGGYINLASDLATLEAAAPGFVTQGKPPSWLTTESIATAQKFPRNADPKVISFLAAYADLSNTERHRLYGSAQTEGELRAFLQQLSDDPFFGGPEVMATQMRGFAQGTAKTATNTLNRYSKGFSPTSVATVFGDEFKPLYAEGGVFTGLGQKSPFVAAAKRKAQPENTTAMLDENGKPKYVPNDQVPAAEAAGWKRE